MSKKRLLSGLICLFLLHAPTISLSANERDYAYYSLDNGLRVMLLPQDRLPLVHIALAVASGAADDAEDECGLAHLLEHVLLFRGREGRNISELRRAGAVFNGHTGFDTSNFEISLPAEELDFALETMRRMVFTEIDLHAEDLEREKEVIAKEILRAEQEPYTTGINLVYREYFKGHSYGRPLAGKMDSLAAIDAERLRLVHRQRFRAANSALVVVGDLDLQKTSARVKEVFSALPAIEFIEKEKRDENWRRPVRQVVNTVEMDLSQAYLFLAYPAPAYNDRRQPLFSLLTQVIGQGVKPMLLPALHGRRMLARNLASSYHVLADAGLLVIALTLDAKRIPAAIRAVDGFMRSLQQQYFSPTDYPDENRIYAFDYLEGARNQILMNVLQSRERGVRLARSLASHLLLAHEERDDFIEILEKAGSSQLRRAAAEFLSRSAPVVVALVPGKSQP